MSLRRQATVVPAPFVASTTQQFDGDDGQWSTFVISVGTPGQSFRVLPSTSGSETWVPVPEACTASGDLSNCPTLRGTNAFNGIASPGFEANLSSTWELIGIYELDLEKSLGYCGNGEYGYDVVKLGNPTGSGLELNRSVVAGIADKSYFLGQFGLGLRPASFSSSANDSKAFLKIALENGQLPSLSYGYTAGTAYQGKQVQSNLSSYGYGSTSSTTNQQGKQVQGSLVLGGYDQSRFQSNTLSFSFASEDARSLTVGVQSIIAENTLLGVASFTESSNGFFAVIDSTVPHLWLPNATCDGFADALGLTLDNQTGLYLVNDTMHAQLTSLNPSFTFKLGNTAYDNGKSINIQLPYTAFDLQATWPIYQTSTNYFPIRRSQNSTQYTLGRTFLQHAYLVVDYERSNFSVHQAVFKDPMPASQIVTMHQPASGGASNDKQSSPSLSAGAIAGIIVGAVAVLGLIGIVTWFLSRRRRSAREARMAAELDAANQVFLLGDAKHEAHKSTISEVEARTAYPELETREGALMAEVAADTPRHELEGPVTRYEMAADSAYAGAPKPPASR